MLVLSRKPGETIIIQDDIEILVTRVERDEVRLKIKAPRELAVFKGELYREIRLLLEAKRGGCPPEGIEAPEPPEEN